MNLEWLLTFRYLSSKNGKFLCSPMSILSILGISIGVATLISVMAVMNGFSEKLLHNILGMNGHIVVHCRDADYLKVTSEIKSIEDVVAAVPVIEGQVIIKSPMDATGAVVRGMEIGSIRDKLAQYIINGNTGQLEEGIILGSRLAEALHVNYGDEITIVSSVDFTTVLGVKPRTQKYRVTGIFNVGMHEYDGAFAFVPLKSAQGLFGYKENVQYVEVTLEDASRSSEIAKLISTKTNMRTEDWKIQQGQYFHALELERDAMFLILALIVIVAAFNIVSGISVLVQDKVKTIAVMRTMGLSKFAVARIFCMCGLLIGTFGTIIGCCVGVLFSLNVEKISDFLETFGRGAFFESIAYCLDGISSQMVLLDVVRVALFSLCISLVAALPPAVIAARKNPVDVLKYE